MGVLQQLNKDKTAFQRIFVQDVRKCEDMLRIIRYLKGLHKAVWFPGRAISRVLVCEVQGILQGCM